MTQHTQGKFQTSTCGEYIWIMDETNTLYLAEIGTEDDEGYHVPIEEARANAQLFAAAPLLLKACQRALENAAVVITPGYLTEIRHAIHRAIG